MNISNLELLLWLGEYIDIFNFSVCHDAALCGYLEILKWVVINSSEMGE